MNHPLLRQLNTDENIGLIDELKNQVSELEKEWSEHMCSDDEVSNLQDEVSDLQDELDAKDVEIQSLKFRITEGHILMTTQKELIDHLLGKQESFGSLETIGFGNRVDIWLDQTKDIKVEA